MKPGAQLITEERLEQIEKHGQSIIGDVEYNNRGQLNLAARVLMIPDLKLDLTLVGKPEGWNERRWLKMCAKSYKERLVIAGALIAAEIDRLQFLE